MPKDFRCEAPGWDGTLPCSSCALVGECQGRLVAYTEPARGDDAMNIADPEKRTTPPIVLRESDRADLRDWLDTSGKWSERMSNLYRLVERIAADSARLAWEQGWVARGNEWAADDNPYATPDSSEVKP